MDGFIVKFMLYFKYYYVKFKKYFSGWYVEKNVLWFIEWLRFKDYCNFESEIIGN